MIRRDHSVRNAFIFGALSMCFLILVAQLILLLSPFQRDPTDKCYAGPLIELHKCIADVRSKDKR